MSFPALLADLLVFGIELFVQRRVTGARVIQDGLNLASAGQEFRFKSRVNIAIVWPGLWARVGLRPRG